MQSNDTVPRKYASREPSVSVSCDACGKPFTLTASRYRATPTHCCSRQCQNSLIADRRRVDPLVRFWARVDKNGPIPPHRAEYGNCWPRSGANCKGYSLFNDGKVKAAKATHFAWNLVAATPITPGTHIGHVCDYPPCIRNEPSGTYEVDGVLYERHGHLWLAGDNVANSKDRFLKGRTKRGTRYSASSQ